MGTPEQNRRYYEKNKDRYKERSHEQRLDRKIRLSKYLVDKSCIQCGFDDPRALQFDHRDSSTKERAVSDMVAKGWGWTRILKEIEKCDILCANCHSIRTSIQFNFYKSQVNLD